MCFATVSVFLERSKRTLERVPQWSPLAKLSATRIESFPFCWSLRTCLENSNADFSPFSAIRFSTLSYLFKELADGCAWFSGFLKKSKFKKNFKHQNVYLGNVVVRAETNLVFWVIKRHFRDCVVRKFKEDLIFSACNKNGTRCSSEKFHFFQTFSEILNTLAFKCNPHYQVDRNSIQLSLQVEFVESHCHSKVVYSCIKGIKDLQKLLVFFVHSPYLAQHSWFIKCKNGGSFPLQIHFHYYNIIFYEAS